MKYIFLLALFLITNISFSQTKRGLLIGISNYNKARLLSEDEWNNIHGADDVDLLVPILIQKGFDAKNLIILKDSTATASAIRESFRELLNTCKENDLIYIHFSCHGQPFEDEDNDENDQWDESLVAYDAKKIFEKGIYEGSNHIKDDELHQYLVELQKKIGEDGTIFVVLDACHIGEAYRNGRTEIFRGTNLVFSPHGKKYYKGDVKRGTNGGFISITSQQNMSSICLIEACMAHQLNMEKNVNGKYYGSLSYHIYKILLKKGIEKRNCWWEDVKKSMDNDPSLINQTAVIETNF